MSIRQFKYCILLIMCTLPILHIHSQEKALNNIPNNVYCWDSICNAHSNLNFTDVAGSTSSNDQNSASIFTEKKTYCMAIKTNLLYDAALIPNIGVEFCLGKEIYVGVNGMYAWWHNDHKHRYWRIYGSELNFRKYFGRKDSFAPFTGHHIGIYGQVATYDFELGAKGIQSNLSYGAGMEYGYSFPIAKSLNLDIAIGLGYIGGEYKVYEPNDGCYVWTESRLRNYIGPSKAEISLVWLVGNPKTKK